MNKKIIAVAMLLLAVVVVFAACKKDDDYKVDHTVTLENGDIVEIYEDEDGENFVTNLEGDKIPVTSDPDGFYDSIADLITETTTKKSDKNDKDDKNSTTTSTTAPNKDNDKEEPSSNDKDEPSTNDKEEPSSNDKEEPSSTNKEEPTSETTTVAIGNSGGGDSISWEDIVNPKP